MTSFPLQRIRREMMKLFGAPVSPFVRKVLAYAAEKGIDLPLTDPFDFAQFYQRLWQSAANTPQCLIMKDHIRG